MALPPSDLIRPNARTSSCGIKARRWRRAAGIWLVNQGGDLDMNARDMREQSGSSQQPGIPRSRRWMRIRSGRPNGETKIGMRAFAFESRTPRRE